MAGSHVDRRGSRGRRQDAVRRAVGLSVRPSVPALTLEPALHRCSPVIEAVRLEEATVPRGTLRGVTKPAPTEPKDLLHVKLLLPRHRHPVLKKQRHQASNTWKARRQEEETGAPVP